MFLDVENDSQDGAASLQGALATSSSRVNRRMVDGRNGGNKMLRIIIRKAGTPGDWLATTATPTLSSIDRRQRSLCATVLYIFAENTNGPKIVNVLCQMWR